MVRSVEVPTRMVHGPGALARLGELQRELGDRAGRCSSPTRALPRPGSSSRALALLDGAVLFDGVRPNPDLELVGEGSAAYREAGCDGLVALGGGSSIDAAKAIGVEIVHGGSILEYEYGGTPLTQRVPPLVAIPTTAGTGSEVTLWAVITDHERQIKFNVGGTPLIGPHAALIDPELMLGLPPAVTAATGLDALSHGIECYTCDYHQPFNDAVALHAIELVGSWLRAAVRGRLQPRGAHAHGARGDARRDELRHGERGRRACDEPVRRRRPRLPARRSHRAGPRPRLRVTTSPRRPSATRGSRRRSVWTRPEWTSTRRRTPGWRRSRA